MDVYVPVATEIEPTQIMAGNSPEEIPYSKNIYTKKHLSLPIAKILPESYFDASLPTAAIYMPYEAFEACFIEASANYQLENEQQPFDPSYYKLFILENTDREKMADTLQQLDENLYVDDTYWRYISIDDSNTFQSFNIVRMGMLLASGLIMFIYGLYLDEENHQDDQFYQTRGVSKKERRCILLGEWLIMWLLVFPISVILNFVLLTRKDTFYSYVFETIPINLFNLLKYTFLTFGGISLLSEVIPIINTKDR